MADGMAGSVACVREQRTMGYAEHREVMLEIQCLQGDYDDVRKAVAALAAEIKTLAEANRLLASAVKEGD